MKKIIKCPICLNTKLSYLKDYEKLYLLKCAKCNFIFDQRVPSSKELNDCYSIYSYSTLRPVSKETINSFNKLLDYFEKYRDTGNILDIGCGQGDFLFAARKRNWNVYGSEYSKAATDLCEKRGIKMYKGHLTKNIFDNIKFDVISSFEVIEHINNPNDFMSLINHKLQDNGLVYCTTPNFNSLLRNFEKDKFMMIAYPEHISFYTKHSIKYLGMKNNFKSLKVKTTGLDLGRLITSIKSNKNEDKSIYSKRDFGDVSDNVRQIANSNILVSFVKVIINYFLSIFGKGDTLKIYWVKK
jgi:2-polyprenyl-3-methyl-5-hydroxy-6-metoxy-1,4-benzoquinol methylase